MLRQDCGEGTIEDLYRGPFAMGVWHNVSIVRQYVPVQKLYYPICLATATEQKYRQMAVK